MSDIMKKALAGRVGALPEADEPVRVDPVPERVLAGVREALLGGETHYTDRPGIKALREAVARRIGLTADQVIITNGEREARFVTELALGEVPGDVSFGTFDERPGLSSFRVGYVAAPPGEAKKIRSLKQALSICTAAPSQRAVILSLDEEAS